MPIVLNGSTGITANNLGVETIVDTAGTGAPSVPNGFEQMFVLPVGTLMWFTGTTAPGGYLVADGSLHSRAAYPDLWSWIVTSGNLAVSDALWDEGQYSPGDGSTTFRLPKVDNRFIRGKSGTRAVGLVEEDAFQGHDHYLHQGPTTGGVEQTPLRIRMQAKGVSISSTEATGMASMVDGLDANNIYAGDIFSDGINGTPRTANETRPKALTMLPCIKAFDSVIDPSILNAAEMVSTINGKLDKDQNIVLGTSVVASGTAIDFVGIPEGVKRVTVMFDGVSTNGASSPLVQIGTGGIMHNSSYLGTAGNHGSQTPVVGVYTIGFGLTGGWASSAFLHGCAILSLSSTKCFWSAMTGRDDFGAVCYGGGSRSITGPVDRIRITTVNGTDLFDAGIINISWEF